MLADLADPRDDGVLQTGRFLVILQLGRVGRHPSEAEHVHARHLGVHLLEGARLHQ